MPRESGGTGGVGSTRRPVGGEAGPGWPPGIGDAFGSRSLGFDLDALRRGLRRRVMWFLVGMALVVVGLQVEPLALGWPLASRTAAWIVGLAVAMIGALGWTAGTGCLGQILGTILLASLVCNATATSQPGTPVLAGAAVVAFVVANVLRRRARARAIHHSLADGVAPRFDVASGQAGTSKRGGSVIDVDAHDKR